MTAPIVESRLDKPRKGRQGNQSSKELPLAGPSKVESLKMMGADLPEVNDYERHYSLDGRYEVKVPLITGKPAE